MYYMGYKHGGDIFEAAKKLNCTPQEILDFSANINPLGVSQQVVMAIQNNLELIKHYPDPRCSELRVSLSRYLNIAPENMLFGNGASELIYLLARVMGCRQAVINAPTFVEYGEAITSAGGVVYEVGLQENDGFALPLAKIRNALLGTDIIFICNPNNPTGRVEKVSIIQSIIEEAQEKNITVVVDEAFIDFVKDKEQYTVLPLLKKYTNLIVLYSMTKFFGIPGLRLGVLLGDVSIIDKMATAKDPWNVNSLAQIAGVAALADATYMKETTELIARERKFLYETISKLPGLIAFCGDANYLLVKINNYKITSSFLADQTAKRGVLVRDCSNFTGLDDSYIRVAVKTRKENEILLEALKEAMKGV